MHDVLPHHGGPARVFAEDILLSTPFWSGGFSGSIGWSQYCRIRAVRVSCKCANLILPASNAGDFLYGLRR